MEEGMEDGGGHGGWRRTWMEEDMEDGGHYGWRSAWRMEKGRSYQTNLLGMHLVSVMGLIHSGISGFVASVGINLLFLVKRKTKWILRAQHP